MKSEHRNAGIECDAFTGWRKYLIYMSRPGVVKSAKRISHRKDRKIGKNKAKQQYLEYINDTRLR